MFELLMTRSKKKVVVNQEYGAAGTYTFKVPAGVTQLSFDIRGAGGGPGGMDTYYRPPDYGERGRDGYTVVKVLPVTPGETLTIVVGSVGSSGSSGPFNQGPGHPGGPSYVTNSAGTNIIYADGGYGGGRGRYSSWQAYGAPGYARIKTL